MIIFFTGTPGSGKTYEAVKKIMDNLRSGRKVYTNIEGMEIPECQEAMKSFLNLDDLKFSELFHHLGSDLKVIQNFWHHCEPGSLVVLDEVQKFFSNRNWQKDENVKFGDWASTHRHDGFDLVIITQASERIDSAVRALAEWNYVFRKVNFLGGAVQKKYICYSYSGDTTQGVPLSKAVRTYNPKVFRCYKSYVTSDTKELSIMKHVNILMHPVFFAIPVVLGICLYMIFFKSSIGKGDLFAVNSVHKKSFSIVSSAEASPPVPIEPLENVFSDPSVRGSVCTRRVKLNNLQIIRKGKPPLIKIIFDHIIYNQDDFPYPIIVMRKQLYADIPVGYSDSLHDDISSTGIVSSL